MDYSLQYDENASVSVKESTEKAEMRRNRILEQSRIADQNRANMERFVEDSKNFLLTEAMYHIFTKCIPETTDASLLSFGRSVIESFVQEENYDRLISQFRTKTVFLSELANILETTRDTVIHDVKAKVEKNKGKDNGDADTKKGDPITKVPSDAVKKLHEKIDRMSSSSEVTSAVMSRVVEAEKEFVKKNVKDQNDMNDMAGKAKKTIDEAKEKAKDDETGNEIAKEHAALYRRRVQDSILDRNKGILESIVYRMSNQIITEASMKEQFTREDGKLDMKRIIEMSEIMYTVLEMVNTAKIKNVTPEYLKETLDSIQ